MTERPLLTWREEKVFKALRAHQREDGSFPTFRELAKIVKIKSHSNIAIVIYRLCRKGYLFRRAGRAHSNTHNGRLYSLTPIMEPPKKEVIIYINGEGRFSHYAASPTIQVKIRKLI